MDYILTIDTGTSSMRGILFDGLGRSLHTSQEKYQVLFPDEIRAEQPSADWKNALIRIIRNITEFAEHEHIMIDAVSLTCQRSSVIPVDRDGRALHYAIMWQDKRNTGICSELKQYDPLIREKTGATVNTVFSGTKMMWIRRNRPEIYEKTYKFLTVADFLVYTMTGEYKTDYTYAGRSLLFNIKSSKWDRELLDLFEVPEEKLCFPVCPGSVIGYISPEFSRLSGLKSGTPVISAGGDQQCAAVGQGVYRPGTMEMTFGSGAYIIAYSKEPPIHVEPGIVVGPGAAAHSYILECSMLCCAVLYNWFRKNFYKDQSIAQINAEVSESAPGANGCVALPYFQGRGTPDWNGNARGLFADLGLNTTRGDMARALLEAIAGEAKNNIDILRKYTEINKEIYISGGLTNFTVFNQILADVCSSKLYRPDNSERTAAGAWLSAVTALGLYQSYEEGFRMYESGEEMLCYTPDIENTKLYDRIVKRMNTLYSRIYSVHNI